jgi:MFS family permease
VTTAVFVTRVYAFKFLDGFVLIYPLYTVMFVEHGLTPSQVAATLTAWAIAAFTLQIPSGVIADRVQRRWLLAAAQVIRAVGFLLWIVEPGFLTFLIGMMLWGAKSALTNGVFEALVYDELHAEGRAVDYARLNGRAQGWGFLAIMATSLSAAAMVGLGYVPMMFGSVAAALACAVIALTLPAARPTLRVARPDALKHLARGFADVLAQPLILGLIGFSALNQAFGMGLDAFWPIFGDAAGLATALIALFVAAISAAQAVGSALAHRIRETPMWASYALFALWGALLLAAAFSLRPWTVALIVLSCGIIKIIDVNVDARLHQAIPTERRATIASVKSFSGQVVMTAMLPAFGAVAQATTYAQAFMATGVAILALGLACLAASAAARRG